MKKLTLIIITAIMPFFGLNRLYYKIQRNCGISLTMIGFVIANLISLSIYASSISVSGTISSNTTWTGVDIVYVTGNISISNGVTLTIDPGISVVFTGYYHIKVNGRLLAIGTVADTIAFTVADTTGYHNHSHTGWKGIELWNTASSNDSTKLVYCKLQYGKDVNSQRGGAILITGFKKLLVDHCDLSYNYASLKGGAIYIWNEGGAKISNCHIHHNFTEYDGGGIFSWDTFILSNNIISDNYAGSSGGGVYVLQSIFTMANNLICNNHAVSQGGAVYINDCFDSFILNNTICNNTASSTGGVYTINRVPEFRNTIIYRNSGKQVGLESGFYQGDFYYCDIEGGQTGIAGSDNIDHYGNCIDEDPLFTGNGSHPYSLQNISSCIDAGDPSTTTAEAGPLDLAGNTRVYNGYETIIDIGAYEYQGDPKPAIITLSPPDNGIVFNTGTILKIEFSTLIIAQSGNITIYNDDETVFEQIAANNSSLVTIDTSTVCINPVNDFITGSSYYILIDSLAFAHINGQKFSGFYDNTDWNISVNEIFSYPGTSLKFDGDNDYVEIDDNNALDLTSNYTIEAWVYPESFNHLGGIVSKYQSSGAHGYYIRLNPDSPYTGLNFDGLETSNGILTANEWYHVVGVNDNGTRKLYVNGELQTLTGTPNTVLVNTNPVRIGVDYSSRYFHGEIDEVRIWNVALTEPQIRENMNLKLSGTETGLVSYFQLNEGQGTNAHDYISGDIGTLFNMTENDWASSSIPFGEGGVNSQIVDITGNVDFTNTALSADFTAKTGTDTIVVARIDTVPNITPATVDTVYDAQYWVVNSFGNGTFTANLSFNIAEDLTPDDQNNPSNVRLYGRSGSSNTDWTLIAPASSVDATSNTATFNDVSSFGQFMLGRHEGTTPFVTTHFSPTNGGLMVNDLNLEITFNYLANEVNGKSIWLYRSDGTLAEEFILPSSQVTGTGTDKITINPTNYLLLDEQYYVLIDNGAFQDPYGKDFAGISNPDTWSFGILVQGHISGNTTWQDTILVSGDVTIDNGATLTILPGSRIEFHEYKKLDVNGTLLAIGTETDKITFTRQPQNGRWLSIRFNYTSSSNDSSKIVHCILEHAEGWSSSYGGPVYVSHFNKLLISNCVFRYNGYLGNMASALQCNNCEFMVKNSIFHDNYGSSGAAIMCGINGNIKIINNVFHDNHSDWMGGAINAYYSQPTLINNTISNNTVSSDDEALGGGLYLTGAAIIARNNIIYGNTVNGSPNQVHIDNDGHDPDFYYCDIEGGKDAFTGDGAGENYFGDYQNNIDADPQFVGTGNHPYELSFSSPGFNAGDPNTTITDVGEYDAAGNLRFQNGQVDMGAYELTMSSDNFPGQAIWFDGNDDYVNLGNDQAFNITNEITVELWMKPEPINSNCYILKKGDFNLLHWDVDYESVSGKGIQINLPGLDTGWWEFQYDMEYGKWYHVAWTYDNNGDLTAYINGKIVRQGHFPGNIEINTSDLIIASLDGSQRYKGVIDEVSISDVAHTPQEIRENMYLALPGFTAGLISSWQMNEGSGTTTNDISHRYPGTLHNMDNSNWHNSSIPFGGGESYSHIVSSTGTFDFVDTDVSIDFTSKTGTDTIVVTRIDTMPNINPGATKIFDSQYWEINNFGNGTFNSNITFTITENLSPEDETSPERIKLYTRNNTSDSSWVYVCDADNVDASSNEITFNGITNFGQFIISRRIIADNFPGTAIEFDGANDYVSGTGLDTTLSAITIEAWVYHNSLPGTVQRYVTISPEVAVLRHDGTAYGGFHELHFYIKQSNGSFCGIRVDSIETTNEWMHIAGTYDGNEMKLYLNGELIKSATPNVGGLFQPNGDFSFSSSGSTMDGKMDEVRIWDHARTEQEIQENMHLSHIGLESGLINYWQMNDGTSNIVKDIVGGNDATMHNMAEDNWVASSIPFGDGVSNTQAVNTSAIFDFTGTSVSMDITYKVGTDEIVVSRIDTVPNIGPVAPYDIFDMQYWAIHKYGSGEFNTNITFTIGEDLTTGDETNPSQIKLYTRGSTADTNWVYLTDAISVDAANDRATFEGITSFSQFLIVRDDRIELDLTAFLEGPYNGTDMYTSLNPDNIPLSQPYNIAPWNYTGTESVASIPDSVVDWVLIELRDTTDAALATGETVIARQAAFILNDGTIVDMAGRDARPCVSAPPISNNLFVVIYHRNHLGIISANPVTESGGVYTYDFTTPSGQAYGSDAQKDLGSGIYGMISADANADGDVNAADKTIWENQAGEEGYKSGDFDLDGQVNNLDKNNMWVPNQGEGGQVPE